jgi:hypothetical protein
MSRYKYKRVQKSWSVFYKSVPVEIRTRDLRLRRPTLYPAELRAHRHEILILDLEQTYYTRWLSGHPDHFFERSDIVDGDTLALHIYPIALFKLVDYLCHSDSG